MKEKILPSGLVELGDLEENTMFNLSRCVLTLLILPAFSAAPTAIAQEAEASIEFIQGQVDDAPKQWRVSLDRNLPTATFSTIAPGVHRVRINAYSDERFSRADSVLVEFTLRESENRWHDSGIEIRYFPFEPQHPRFSFGSGHGRGGVEVRSLEIEPLSARLNAEVAATLFYHQSPNTRPISQRTEEIALEIDLPLIRN